MAKVSPELLARLREQRKRMEPAGAIIDNKSLTRIRFRVLPVFGGNFPGVEYVSFYSKELGRGTSSPASWGLPCPIEDYIRLMSNSMSPQAVKERVDRAARRSRENWISGIDRSDEGSPEAPNVRILRAKQTVFQSIVDWMIGGDDADDSDDITHPTEGRDILVKKTGTGLDTKWTADKCDRSPISADPAMAKSWIALAKHYDVRAKFFPVDADVLAQMYAVLTAGDDIPDRYLDAISQVVKGGAKFSGVSDEDGGVEVPQKAAASVRVRGAAAPVREDLTGKSVSFEYDDGVRGNMTVQGVVAGRDTDEPGDVWLVRDVLDVGTDAALYSMDRTALMILETAPDEEEEAPEEAPPTVKRKASEAKPAAMPRKPEKASSAIKDKLRRK